MKPTVSYLTLAVTSVEASLAFYRDGLGLGPWKPIGSGVAVEASGQTIVLHPREALVELLGLPGGSLQGHGVLLSHNVETRAAVDQLAERLASRGGRVLRPPRVLPWGDYAACVADPDGHPWEIVHSPPRQDRN